MFVDGNIPSDQIRQTQHPDLVGVKFFLSIGLV